MCPAAPYTGYLPVLYTTSDCFKFDEPRSQTYSSFTRIFHPSLGNSSCPFAFRFASCSCVLSDYRLFDRSVLLQASLRERFCLEPARLVTSTNLNLISPSTHLQNHFHLYISLINPYKKSIYLYLL